MSILVVNLVPEGVLFAADRNITTTVTEQDQGLISIVQGQSQRPKVLKWPNQEVIIGYVGAAEIYKLPTDLWLYHSIIGRNLKMGDLAPVAQSLTDQLNDALKAHELEGSLIIHLAGFEKVSGEWRPLIYFIHNTEGLTTEGEYILGHQFICSEEISRPIYFGNKSGNTIRGELANSVKLWGLFSFRQGHDLGAFNTFDATIRHAMRSIVETHPKQLHPFPTTLEEWAKHSKMAVLVYGAYFEAFYPAYQQLVGGGVDVVWAAWPALRSVDHLSSDGEPDF